MTGRALIGIAIGGFWSMSAATALRLVPRRRVPHALAIFNGGNALATVIAAPLGSYLGAVMGWRGAFLCLVPVAIAAFIWACFSLPAMGPRQQQAARAFCFSSALPSRCCRWSAGLRAVLYGAVLVIHLRTALS